MVGNVNFFVSISRIGMDGVDVDSGNRIESYENTIVIIVALAFLIIRNRMKNCCVITIRLLMTMRIYCRLITIVDSQVILQNSI